MTPVKGSDHKAMAVDVDEPDQCVHTVVIDGSSFTFIDSMGLQVLPSVSILILRVPCQQALGGESFRCRIVLLSSSELLLSS